MDWVGGDADPFLDHRTHHTPPPRCRDNILNIFGSKAVEGMEPLEVTWCLLSWQLRGVGGT